MREGLTGLTIRGRAFLAAGVTAVVCALVIGQPALTRVGVLLMAVPLLTAFLVGRSRYRLALVRTVTPQLVSAGQPARVRLTLTNEGRTPTGVLLLEDQVPYVLGTRPRFVLEGIGHGWRRHVTYQVRSDVRGRFEIGPMSVRVTDPFGLVELGRAFTTTVPLTVTPRTVPLPAIPLGGVWTGSGDNRPRAFASGSAEDVTVREYRRGDDLRRVHWRSSARVGRADGAARGAALAVARHAVARQPARRAPRAGRRLVPGGRGLGGRLDRGPPVPARLLRPSGHGRRRGAGGRLAHPSGRHERRSPARVAGRAAGRAASRFDTGWLADPGQGSLVVAVFGAFEEVDGPVLRRMRMHTPAALALALDVQAWAPDSPATIDGAATLALHGWRAVPLRPGSRLDAVWQDLGRLGARQTSGGPEAEPEELVR